MSYVMVIVLCAVQDRQLHLLHNVNMLQEIVVPSHEGTSFRVLHAKYRDAVVLWF